MAKKYGTSDLGSDWITVPRKFRGRKPTSSDTHLAYITRPEMKALGLLSQAKKMQVGPANIPSFDDSGYDPDWDPTKYDPNTAGSYRFGQRGGRGGGRTLADIQKAAQKSILSQAKSEKKAGNLGTSMREATKKADRYKELTKGGPGSGGGKTDIMSGPEFDDNRWKNVPEGSGDGGDTTPSGDKGIKCTGGQVLVNGVCQDPDTKTEEDKCKGKDLSCSDGSTRTCDPKTGKTSACPTTKECPHGADGQGNCLPKPGGVEEDGTPSLTTINQPDETPMLQTLTDEMDLRNMLSNVLNKNNPLFKQARTRALQAMAGRGTVNSSMAEQAVTSAILNIAMPIATRVIDDLQRVMAANVNATNAFKQAVNEAYYKELLLRVEAANTWNLSRMTEAGANWRAIIQARGKAADTSDPKVFERYMDMLGGSPAFHLGTPTYDIAGT